MPTPNPRHPDICTTDDAEARKFTVDPVTNNVEVRVSDNDALEKLCDILEALGGDTAGTCISQGVTAVPGSLTFTDVINLTLTTEKTYKDLEYSASCVHTTLWHIVKIDDAAGSPTETVINAFITGAGTFTMSENLDCGDFNTTGGTGVQELVLRGKNLRKTSDFHGYLGIKEV